MRQRFVRYLGTAAVIVTLYTSCQSLWSASEAKDLTEVFGQGFSFAILGGGDASAGAVIFAPAFSAAVAQAVTQEFPLASVAPAFTYRFDPSLGARRRATGVPGPLFSERALTLGSGELNFGVGYSFIDFSDINARDLADIRSPGLFNSPELERAVEVPVVPPNISLNPGEKLFVAPFSAVQLRTRLDVQAHLVVPAIRYGISERWDVAVTLPIVNTLLRVRNRTVPLVDADPARARFVFAEDEQGRRRAFGTVIAGNQPLSTVPFVRSARRAHSVLRRAAGSATGIGDLSLRTKYHFWRSEAGGGALGLNLQLPTGEVRDFHGTEETHLSAFIYLSQVLGERVEPHLNVGLDFNTDDVDRSSVVYAVGATLLLGTHLGLAIDFIGRSEFGRLQVRVPAEGIYTGVTLDKAADTCTTADPCFINGQVSFPFLPIAVKRNDIADFSFGLRYALGTAGSVFVGGLVPLNDDGIRPEFIPAAGVEYTF